MMELTFIIPILGLVNHPLPISRIQFSHPIINQGTLRGLLEYFISEHNKMVEDKKKFTIGNVTVIDNNDYIHLEGRVLDYLADFSETSLKKVEFGKNLTDVKINTDHTERATALIPLGAKIIETDDEGIETETDKRVTIFEIIQQDFETSITQNSTEIRFDFMQVTDKIKNTVSDNQLLLEEYIRFKGALIELGKVGNAFTAELSGEYLAFKFSACGILCYF